MYYCATDAIVETIANCPTPHAFTLLVEKLSDNDSIQTFKTWCDSNGYNATVFVRSGYPNWGNGWRQLATATPPQEFDLPLAEGVTTVGAGYKNVYSKDQFGIVRVWFSVHFDSIPTSGTHVFNLPEGFRPDSTCCSAAILSMAEYYNAIVAIHPSGDALVDHGTIGQSGTINLHGYIEFPAD